MKFLIGLTALLMASCATGDSRHPAPGARHAATNEDASVLMKADRDFARATAERRIEGWVSFFDPRGSQFSEERGMVTGHEAIRAFMGPAFADPNYRLEWDPVRADISRGGTLGYTWGRWISHALRDSKERVASGDYLTVWRKQPDGSWLVLFDAGDRDP